MADNKDLLASIEKGAALKHADTKDTSAPKIEGIILLLPFILLPFLPPSFHPLPSSFIRSSSSEYFIFFFSLYSLLLASIPQHNEG